MIDAIATVAVYVEDQEEAVGFRHDKIGFEVRRRESMGQVGDWVEVAPPGALSRLVLYPKALMANWQGLKPSIVFECTDIGNSYRSLKDNGAAFLEEPKKMGWGTYARFQDTDGNEFLRKGP